MQVKNELRGNLYNQPFRSHHKKKSFQTSQTTEALPTISRSLSQQKSNNVRKHINETKSKVIQMEARLNNLKNLKNQFQNKHKNNLTRINFLNNVKERVRQDQQYKQRTRQQRHESLMQLKCEATDLRQSIVKQKKQSKDQMVEKKSIDAAEERRRHKQHEYLMKKLKEIDVKENRKKAEKIRQYEDQTASKLKEFHASRLSFSRKNYQNKLIKTLKQRQKVEQTLQRLREEQDRLLSTVKNSQQTMLTSLYSLVTINPQQKIRKSSFYKDLQPSQYNDIDNYQNEDFET